MQPEHLVLCGGLESTRKSGAKAYRLSLAGLNQNITLRISDIRRALVTDLPEALADLLELAAYIYCADSTVRRGGNAMTEMGRDWRRRFRFVVPVRLPDLWSSAEISALLSEVLGFLSDDFYEFDFQPLRNPQTLQSYLDLTGGEPHGFRPDTVLLFSGGLDSLAGAIEELIGNKRRVALVSHRSAPKIASWQSELVDALQKRFGRQWVFHVPVLLNKDRTIGREYTQRSRSFLYAALGFVVARIFGLSSIQIFENGIISFNFPLIPHVLGARASRTTHPQALHGFAGLFSAIVGESFIVNNPFLWKTKSQILKMIAELDCAELIGGTVSCAHVRDMTVLHPHCGVCSQCIDRRFAVLAAGLGVHDPETLYRLDPLVGDLPRGVARTMAEAYVRSASDIDRMNDLAFFSRFGEAGRAVRFLSDNANEAGRKIYELHKRHANEVCAVVDNAIRSNASALRSHSLPASCLVVLALPKRGDVESFIPSTPLKDPAELEFESELEAAQSGIEIRIAFDDEKQDVILGPSERLGRASYSLLNSLRPEYEAAKQAGKAPENHPFIDGHKLADRLCIAEASLRRRISRFRGRLNQSSVAAVNGPLSADAVIENEPWLGYRLNPAVLVLAASELSSPHAVTSPKR